MRTTMHNGRAGKNGAFKASHNDRDFDLEKADHIDQTKTSGNWTWHCYQKQEPGMTFEAAEKLFYERYFGQSLEAKNERYRKNRHAERVQTMDEYRTSRQGCPEETILQIGKMGDTVPAPLLKRIAIEQINWEQKTFPNVRILDAALHVDEEGAPHLHQRKVWVANSKDGKVVGQEKALKEMGIQRPNMGKKEGRYNNAKMSYTEQCREHFQYLCKKHGLEIEIEPKDASEAGLSLLEYQRQQEQEKLDAIKAEQKAVASDTERRRKAADAEIRQKKAEFDKYTKETMESAQNDAISTAKKNVDGYLKKRLSEVAKAQTAVQNRENAVSDRENAVTDREKELQKREDRFIMQERRSKSILQKREESIKKREDALAEKEKRLADQEGRIGKRLTELHSTEKKLDVALNDAYWEMEGEKQKLKKATEKELEERNNRYEDGDFGKAVQKVDQMVKGLSL